MLYGTFVHGSVDSLVAAGSDLRHKYWKHKDTVFPPVAPHRRDSALTGSQSYKTTRTYLTFSPKSIQFLSGMSNATEPRKTFLSPLCQSVSPVPIQHHHSLYSRFSCFSASVFCPDRPRMTAGLIRQTLSPHYRIDYWELSLHLLFISLNVAWWLKRVHFGVKLVIKQKFLSSPHQFRYAHCTEMGVFKLPNFYRNVIFFFF